MLNRLKTIIRKITPEPMIFGYHFLLAKVSAVVYGNPSKKLFVIGITGTKGKTSTANFVWSVLNAAGIKAGQIGTANIRIGDKESLNHYHMTMPGRFVLQKLLRQMVHEGCTHAVMEVTSEGIKLARNRGIIFDCAIFTNLTPEHLPSHGGSFERYKKTKGKLFENLMKHEKILAGQKVERTMIVNADDEHADYFLQFPADKKITYGIKNSANIKGEKITDSKNGVDFEVNSQNFHLAILGAFNVYNALPAIAVGKMLNLPDERINRGLSTLKKIEGRMEQITEGQSFMVIVDYAHEKVSMNALLDTAKNISEGNKIIVLLGAEGGGRDKAKRAHMGEAAAKKADYVIISNVDPYDDDPQEIIHDIADVAVMHGKVIGQNLFREPDRRKGIAKALSLANPGDIVLITGKGAEQSMIIAGKSIPWDDRIVVKEELQKMLGK